MSGGGRGEEGGARGSKKADRKGSSATGTSEGGEMTLKRKEEEEKHPSAPREKAK